ncbi:uncharacterized protein TM35_000041320 [Trypanosoma theileri]|uniref:Uncharacterized protein n=1 Tax=Trypanosoma theileri TaxID=67003 RepID=A0A1X0P503_9TRYP|nr:uncharacterized protein TM35_000041320 [Trypanosoma theileri]ORC91918.1 hypothetical protein TM35_000041320 [Trypanosoma theileri]
MAFPLLAFSHRKLEPMLIIPYSFEGGNGPANSLLESLRVHKLQTSYSTGISRVVLGENFIQEDPGARISLPSEAVSFTYFTLVRMLLGRGTDPRDSNNYSLQWWKLDLAAEGTQRGEKNPCSATYEIHCNFITNAHSPCPTVVKNNIKINCIYVYLCITLDDPFHWINIHKATKNKKKNVVVWCVGSFLGGGWERDIYDHALLNHTMR